MLELVSIIASSKASYTSVTSLSTSVDQAATRIRVTSTEGEEYTEEEGK